MKKKQQWLRGWMREKVRAGEIPGWVRDCLDGEIPGEIPAPDTCHATPSDQKNITIFWLRTGKLGCRVVSEWRNRGERHRPHVKVDHVPFRTFSTRAHTPEEFLVALRDMGFKGTA